MVSLLWYNNLNIIIFILNMTDNKKNDGTKPNRIEMLKLMHTQRDKTPIDDASYEIMVLNLINIWEIIFLSIPMLM